MIINKADRSFKTRVAMREGPGEVFIRDICSKEDIYEKGRTYAQMLLKKNCGIGVHKHEGEKEIFVINKGRAVYNDDGIESEVKEGDVMICEDGHSHGITNIFDEECEFTALIILK
ncbi:MAG: cupin domain-containing protein [Erysipelotrichaceae bacterium]|nr:cupin domain-containing protein [Erysipelotrichaceae bacterium]